MTSTLRISFFIRFPLDKGNDNNFLCNIFQKSDFSAQKILAIYFGTVLNFQIILLINKDRRMKISETHFRKKTVRTYLALSYVDCQR